MADDTTILGVLNGIRDLCSSQELNDGERLEVLSIAWIQVARAMRSTALAFPDGFPAERARQVAVLERMAALVRDETPDLELERLVLENDVSGVQQHLRGKLGDPPT